MESCDASDFCFTSRRSRIILATAALFAPFLGQISAFATAGNRSSVKMSGYYCLLKLKGRAASRARFENPAEVNTVRGDCEPAVAVWSAEAFYFYPAFALVFASVVVTRSTVRAVFSA